ncbi:hypothetical protein HanIR_Chr00c28g0911461 [Helianthus annuus]|nr:hypothetical protein HanIR_Chr00c28g0911461 [Helianthus annuus]
MFAPSSKVAAVGPRKEDCSEIIGLSSVVVATGPIGDDSLLVSISMGGPSKLVSWLVTSLWNIGSSCKVFIFGYEASLFFMGSLLTALGLFSVLVICSESQIFGHTKIFSSCFGVSTFVNGRLSSTNMTSLEIIIFLFRRSKIL